MRPIIDAHLDLAWSALYFNRDLLATVDDVRASERELTDELSRARNTVTFPELRKARAGVVISTLLARSGPEMPKRNGFKRVSLDYENQTIAYAHAKGQLAYYRLLESQGHLKFICTRAELAAHWKLWSQAPDTAPLGIILSMEGADAIVNPGQVAAWWHDGLRAVGPVHYGRSQYAHGTATDGPLSPAGIALIKEFDRVGMILDVTHLSDQSFFEALDISTGPLLASHHNCRALVPGDRQLTDEQIKLVVKRGGVIGTAFDNWMLYPGWKRGETDPNVVKLAAAADHIDHICQLAGNATHCALGTDLDGGFGTEQTPGDLNKYSDLHALEQILAQRGYQPADIDGIFFGNWLRFFGAALP